jgi:hypothetical protein
LLRYSDAEEIKNMRLFLLAVHETTSDLSDVVQKFWILFTLIATIITICTYVNAKKSLFHPLHSEVIKRQTDRFVEVYDLLSGDVFEKIDYSTIYNICFYCGLKELNYDMPLPDEVLDEIGEELDDLNFVFGIPIENIDEETMLELDSETQKLIKDSIEYYENVSNEDLIQEEIDEYEFENSQREETVPHQIKHLVETVIIKGRRVHLGLIPSTKKANNFCNKLELLKNDPLLPTDFRELLNELFNQVTNNKLIFLHNAADRAINFVWEKDTIELDEIETISIEEYNNMVKSMQNHNQIISRIFDRINKYLKIDNLFK